MIGKNYPGVSLLIALNQMTTFTTQQPQLKPIESPKLYLIAASQIAEGISRGRWNPNDKLPSERELAQIFNISRSSVRQALTALEAVGVIYKKVGVGSFVTEGAMEVISQEIVSELVTEGDPLLLVEARQVLEPGIVKLAAQCRENEDLVRIESALERMDQYSDESISSADFVDADIDFHLSIALASRNPLLIRLFEEVIDRMRHRVWLKAAFPIVAKRASQYQAQHHSIYKAIRNKETTKAQDVMTEHLDNIRANLISFSAISTEQSNLNPGKK
jgi:GntR family transcriptional repressor for pyruvate dehydrogenase complex